MRVFPNGPSSTWICEEWRMSALHNYLNKAVLKTENDQQRMESSTNSNKRLGQDCGQSMVEDSGWLVENKAIP